MQKDEQLRRRDPKAYCAMILERKEKELRPFRQAPTHSLPSATAVYPATGSQPVRWDAPMLATGEMLRPPSTAPNAASGTGSMLDIPRVLTNNAAVSTTLDQPRPRPLSPSSPTAGKGTSINGLNQMKPIVEPQFRSKTPEFTSHDLQKHIEDSITFLAKNHISQLEEALGEAIGNLFRDGPSDGSVINKGLVPKAMRKATREDFQAIISRKCLENKYEQIPESLRLKYARQLRGFIVQKAKTEEEHRRLASKVKLLLDNESVNPEILLKVMGDTLRPVKPTEVEVIGQNQPDTNVDGLPEHVEATKKALPAAEQRVDRHESESGPINGVNNHETKLNGSKEKKGGRKRSVPADEEHSRKKAKRASAPATNFAESNHKMFTNLLNRETARGSSKGGEQM